MAETEHISLSRNLKIGSCYPSGNNIIDPDKIILTGIGLRVIMYNKSTIFEMEFCGPPGWVLGKG